MRLFAALDLSAEARMAIAAEQKRIMSHIGEIGARLRAVKPDLMHVTLTFIGELEEGRAQSVVDAMDSKIDQARFEVAFAGVGVFPPHGRPRALFLGIAKGAAETITLQRRVAAILETVGIPPEPRPFDPHLTLARWRDGRPGDRHLAAATNQTATVTTMDVVEVGLYQSRLSSKGPAYTRLARAPLA